MPNLPSPLRALVLLPLLVAGCREPESGPVSVSAIGGPPALANPNRVPLDPPSAMLTAAVAQGLVRFDQAGQIEPGLAQSWTVSDDGMSYVFRLDRTSWPDGREVKADQVADRLRAAASRASRNRLKPLLGAIADIMPMTDRVIEIRLKAPRPNFLQLLAQPEMAIIRSGQGTGPFTAQQGEGGALRLRLRAKDEVEQEVAAPGLPDILLHGERAALAVARFDAGLAAFVTGGTAIDLSIARAAQPPAAALRFDPVEGLFGLTVTSRTGIVGSAGGRRALSMAIDRAALVTALAVPTSLHARACSPPASRSSPSPLFPPGTQIRCRPARPPPAR
jgi:peptide/nickel transport system substrate-binding protein